MITVHSGMTEDQKSFILEVKGHADAGAYGHDLVCASASILTYTLAECVMELDSEGKLKKRPTIRLDAGNAVIVARPRKDMVQEVSTVFRTITQGYRALSRTYGQYIVMNEPSE